MLAYTAEASLDLLHNHKVMANRPRRTKCKATTDTEVCAYGCRCCLVIVSFSCLKNVLKKHLKRITTEELETWRSSSSGSMPV